MLGILNSFNAHNFPIFQPILMILVSKFMFPRVLSDRTYFLLGLLSPLNWLPFRPNMSECITIFQSKKEDKYQEPI